MAEERRRSKEGNAAAADKAARKDVKRFLADGDEDLELESGAEDEFVPEVELFPETEPEPAASTKVQKNNDDIPNIALASGIGLRPTVRRFVRATSHLLAKHLGGEKRHQNPHGGTQLALPYSKH
ncbi:hypothetical protein OYC64_000068 [Pagothenia borchgrevinki]|uniref:Uncharacterized protein n=1 Tax=Pagothenia borchgrevinki TaxID=8213 RepID=A0ABD2HC04_PAGBO